MFDLHPDVKITRRGRLNMIVDKEGSLQFSSASLIATLDWLIDKGTYEVDVIGEEGAYRVTFHKITP